MKENLDKLSEAARLGLLMMGLVYLDDTKQLRNYEGKIVGTLKGVAVEKSDFKYEVQMKKPIKFIPITIHLQVEEAT